MDIGTLTTSVNNDIPICRLLQLASPALPVGAYSYSTGLEYAVHRNWISSEQDAHDWITEIACHNVCHLDIPVIGRMFDAWKEDDLSKVFEWSQFLIAFRESSELLAEDRQMGIALAKLLSDLGIRRAKQWIDAVETSWATLFSLAACEWGINKQAMQHAYLWVWCEHQVASAIRLVPLGQTSGQRILSHCAKNIPEWIDAVNNLEDDNIGQTAPAMAIGSALHEDQYSRMFRS